MFADIKGYSNLTDVQLSAFMNKFIGDLAHAVIDRYRGELVEFNTWGDAYFAVSRNVTSLAEFSLALRDHFNNFPWSRHSLPKLQVRTSLHMGSVFVGRDPLRQRNGVAGVHVNLGARIEPVTQPGEVWVSQGFYTLISQDPQSVEFRFDPLGFHDLPKDHGAVSLYRLCRGSEPSGQARKNPQARLSEIIKRMQFNLVRSSPGTSPGEVFTRTDLVEFVQQMTAKNVALILKDDSSFRELLGELKSTDISEWKNLEACVRPLRPTWAENRRIEAETQTEAGQEAERILASLILYVLRAELMELKVPGCDCSEIAE